MPKKRGSRKRKTTKKVCATGGTSAKHIKRAKKENEVEEDVVLENEASRGKRYCHMFGIEQDDATKTFTKDDWLQFEIFFSNFDMVEYDNITSEHLTWLKNNKTSAGRFNYIDFQQTKSSDIVWLLRCILQIPQANVSPGQKVEEYCFQLHTETDDQLLSGNDCREFPYLRRCYTKTEIDDYTLVLEECLDEEHFISEKSYDKYHPQHPEYEGNEWGEIDNYYDFEETFFDDERFHSFWDKFKKNPREVIDSYNGNRNVYFQIEHKDEQYWDYNKGRPNFKQHACDIHKVYSFFTRSNSETINDLNCQKNDTEHCFCMRKLQYADEFIGRSDAPVLFVQMGRKPVPVIKKQKKKGKKKKKLGFNPW